jgi:hypothetical protein
MALGGKGKQGAASTPGMPSDAREDSREQPATGDAIQHPATSSEDPPSREHPSDSVKPSDSSSPNATETSYPDDSSPPPSEPDPTPPPDPVDPTAPLVDTTMTPMPKAFDDPAGTPPPTPN